MDAKCGEFWWVRVKLTPPLTPPPYQKGEVRLAKITGPAPDNPKLARLIDCIHTSYLHINYVDLLQRIDRPE